MAVFSFDARVFQVPVRFVLSPAQTAKSAPVRSVRYRLRMVSLNGFVSGGINGHHLRFRAVESSLPSCPISEAGDIEEATGVSDLSIDEVHGK